jgi:predicted O-methyltransferase YrrM
LTADDVLRSIEAEAMTKGLPIIGPGRGAYLDELVNQYKPRRVLEVGTLVGYSAIRMGRLLPRGGKIVCIENDPAYVQIAKSNIAKAWLSDRIEVMTGDALRVVSKLTGQYDLVFIDAEKRKYLEYLKACERLLRSGSVVVADNVKVFANEVADYLDYVRNSGLYISTYREERFRGNPSATDAIETSIRK